MKNYLLSEKELKIIQTIIQHDIEDLINTGDDYFDDLLKQGIAIKEYVNDRIELAEKFEVDFWLNVRLFGNDFTTKRLLALYNEIPISDFISTYKIPSEATALKNLFIDLNDLGRKKE
jgi:hypothetical protein